MHIYLQSNDLFSIKYLQLEQDIMLSLYTGNVCFLKQSSLHRDDSGSLYQLQNISDLFESSPEQYQKLF